MLTNCCTLIIQLYCTGPIIGEVTTTSARILVEIDRLIDITCHVKPTTQRLSEQINSFSKEQKMELNDPETVYVMKSDMVQDLTLEKKAIDAITKHHPEIGDKLHWDDSATHKSIVHDSHLPDRMGSLHINDDHIDTTQQPTDKYITKQLKPYQVTVFVFTDLIPDTKYDIYLTGECVSDSMHSAVTPHAIDIDLQQEKVLIETLANELSSEQPHIQRSETLKQAEIKRNQLIDDKYNEAIQLPRGRFNTFLQQPADMRFGVLSCNQIATDHKKDMWEKLALEIKDEKIDIIFHIGDQIYADHSESLKLPAEFQDIWNVSCQWLLAEPNHDNWIHYKEKILFLYRQLYRTTFSHSPTQFILSHVSNLMVFDDHDAHDDWGVDPEDVDRSTAQWFVGKCAYRAICEYQHQQWKDIDFNELDRITDADELHIDHVLTRDYHKHKYGAIGVYMSDNRGNQSVHYGEEQKSCPFLGLNQWKDLESAIGSTDGYFSDCKILVMNFPVPLVYLPHNLNDAIARVYDDALGHWSSAQYRREQIRMLDMLRDWVDARPVGERQIILTGGDVHIGGHTEIYYNHKFYFHQIICSAISNNPLSTPVFYAVKTVASMVSHLDYGWTFKHHGFHKGANYGIVHCSFLDNTAQPVIFSQLVTWSRKHQIHVSTCDHKYYATEEEAQEHVKQELTVKPSGSIRSEIKKFFSRH